MTTMDTDICAMRRTSRTRDARRALAHEQLLQSPTKQSTPTKEQHQPPKHEWWQTEHDPNVNHYERLAKQRQLRDEVRRQEQNTWLGKHAKQRRFEFSGEQKKMLRQWFNALDADGSGKISVEVSR